MSLYIYIYISICIHIYIHISLSLYIYMYLLLKIQRSCKCIMMHPPESQQQKPPKNRPKAQRKEFLLPNLLSSGRVFARKKTSEFMMKLGEDQTQLVLSVGTGRWHHHCGKCLQFERWRSSSGAAQFYEGQGDGDSAIGAWLWSQCLYMLLLVVVVVWDFVLAGSKEYSGT